MTYSYSENVDFYKKNVLYAKKDVVPFMLGKGFQAGYKAGKFIYTGFIFGFLGIVFGVPIYFSRRRDVLLLKYHDELMKKNDDSLE